MAQELEEQPVDLGDEAQVKARNKRVKLASREHEEVLELLMSRPEGRRWMFAVLEQCHMYHSTFDPNPTVMAFREGARNVGLQLLNAVTLAAPEQYMLMLKERANV